MNEALWIRANLEGRTRWYIAIDRGDSIYFPEIDFEEDMDLETYQTEFPHFKVRAIPTVEEWEAGQGELKSFSGAQFRHMLSRDPRSHEGDES
jgi:hypothetical protein